MERSHKIGTFRLPILNSLSSRNREYSKVRFTEASNHYRQKTHGQSMPDCSPQMAQPYNMFFETLYLKVC